MIFAALSLCADISRLAKTIGCARQVDVEIECQNSQGEKADVKVFYCAVAECDGRGRGRGQRATNFYLEK